MIPPASELCPECGLKNALLNDIVYFNAEFKVGVMNLYILILVMFDSIDVSAPSITCPTAEYLKTPVKFSNVSVL